MEPVVPEGGIPKVEFFQVATSGSTGEEVSTVTLDPLDRSLNFLLSDDNLTGCSMTDGGFRYMWSGARATLGVLLGKYYFRCQIIREVLPKGNIPAIATGEVDASCQCRVGVSTKACEVFFLGETKDSWGYDCEGKSMHDSIMKGYGERILVQDEIICLVDLMAKPQTVGFVKNKKPLGVAFQLDLAGGQAAVFPHVLVKNMEVRLDFEGTQDVAGNDEEESYLKGYKPWKHALMNVTSVNMAPQKTISFTECEVLMLVGLPGSGKTTWAREYMKEHPQKRYIILGNILVEEQMRIPRGKRKQDVTAQLGKLDTLVTEVFNELLNSAAKLPRNYILDQTNVYGNARSRKLKPFMLAGFRRRAAVFVIPDEVLFCRQQKQHVEEGKFVPDQEIAEMKANFNPPSEGRWPNFNEVMYVARKPPESYRIIEDQRMSSQKWLIQNRKRSSKDMDELSQSGMSNNVMMGMEGHEAMHLPPDPSGPGIHLMQGMPHGMGHAMGAFNRPRPPLGPDMPNRPHSNKREYGGGNDMHPRLMPGGHNQSNLPGSSFTEHPLTHKQHPCASPLRPYDKPRPPNSRHPVGSRKATGVNAIPVGPRRAPSVEPNIHPMALEYRGNIEKHGGGNRYQHAGTMARARGEDMEPLNKHGLGSTGRRTMSMGHGPMMASEMDMMHSDYSQGMDGRGRSRSAQDIGFAHNGPSNGWGGTNHHMGESGHKPSHKKARTRGLMLPPGTHSKQIPYWQRQNEILDGPVPHEQTLDYAGSHLRQPSLSMQNGLTPKQPPPPPRKPTQGGSMQTGRPPFTVNGLTVIPPAPPASQRDSQRPQMMMQGPMRGTGASRGRHASFSQEQASQGAWLQNMPASQSRMGSSLSQGHHVAPSQADVASRHQYSGMASPHEHNHMLSHSSLGQHHYPPASWDGSRGDESGAHPQIHPGAAAGSSQQQASSNHSKWETKENNAPGLFGQQQAGVEHFQQQHNEYYPLGLAHSHTGNKAQAGATVSGTGIQQMPPSVVVSNGQTPPCEPHGGAGIAVKQEEGSNVHWKMHGNVDVAYAGGSNQYHMGYDGSQNGQSGIPNADGQMHKYGEHGAQLGHSSRMPQHQTTPYMQGGGHPGVYEHQGPPPMDYHHVNQVAAAAAATPSQSDGHSYGETTLGESGGAQHAHAQQKGYSGGGDHHHPGSEQHYSSKIQQHYAQPPPGQYGYPGGGHAQSGILGNPDGNHYMATGENYLQNPSTHVFDAHGDQQAANSQTVPLPEYQSAGYGGNIETGEDPRAYSQYQFAHSASEDPHGRNYTGYDYNSYDQAAYGHGNQVWNGYAGYALNAYGGNPQHQSVQPEYQQPGQGY